MHGNEKAWFFGVFLNITIAVVLILSASAATLHERHKRETITVEEGWITSPQWPNNYPSNFNNTLTIGGNCGGSGLPCQATLQYEYYVEPSADCVYDKLILNAGAPNQRKVCGSGKGTYGPVTISGDKGLPIQFTSDFSVELKGFNISYQITREQVVTTTTAIPDGRALDSNTIKNGCNVDRWGDDGVFESPNYPNNYPTMQDCTYVAHLTKPGTQTVHVAVTYDLEHVNNCIFDYLKWTGVDRVCGQSTQSLDVKVDSQFEVRFHSDNAVNRPGFRLIYNVTSPPPPAPAGKR